MDRLRRMLLLLGVALGWVSLPPTVDPSAGARKGVLGESEEGVRIGVGTWLPTREKDWTLDFWGLTRGTARSTKGELIDGGGLRIRIGSSHMFTGTDIVLEICRTPKGELHCEARVSHWSDESADRPWKSPRGVVLISSDDWSRALQPGAPPFIVEFRLHDVPMDDYSCVHGIVEVPKRAD